MIGMIYVIKNTVNNMLYVGSTSGELNIRMKQHLRDMYKHPNIKLYRAMKEFQPSNFYINLLEEFACENIRQLRKQEGKYIRIIKPELNKNIAGRSVEEYKEDNKDALRVYRKLYYRKYREAHREKFNQYHREYYRKRKS